MNFPSSDSVDPEVERFMLERMGARFIGADPGRPGHARWCREPIVQGDQTSYEFSTPSSLKFDGYFFFHLADALYNSGVKHGHEKLCADLRKLIDVRQ
jgi:hypothetical protein